MDCASGRDGHRIEKGKIAQDTGGAGRGTGSRDRDVRASSRLEKLQQVEMEHGTGGDQEGGGFLSEVLL